MVFYKGGLQHSEKDIITIPELLNLRDSCIKINKALLAQQKKSKS